MREGNSGVHETVRQAGVKPSSSSTYSPEGNWKGFRGNDTHEGNEATRDREYGSAGKAEVDKGRNPHMVIIQSTPPLPSEEPKTIEKFMRDRELVSNS